MSFAKQLVVSLNLDGHISAIQGCRTKILGWTDETEKDYWCSSGAHLIWNEAWGGAHKGFVEHLTLNNVPNSGLCQQDTYHFPIKRRSRWGLRPLFVPELI